MDGYLPPGAEYDSFAPWNDPCDDVPFRVAFEVFDPETDTATLAEEDVLIYCAPETPRDKILADASDILHDRHPDWDILVVDCYGV